MSDYVPGPWLIDNPGEGAKELWAEARAQLTDRHWRVLARLADPQTAREEYRANILGDLYKAGYIGINIADNPYVLDRGYVALFEHNGGDYIAYCREKWGEQYANRDEIRRLMDG